MAVLVQDWSQYPMTAAMQVRCCTDSLLYRLDAVEVSCCTGMLLNRCAVIQVCCCTEYVASSIENTRENVAGELMIFLCVRLAAWLFLVAAQTVHLCVYTAVLFIILILVINLH
ncbi:hypothetical protein HOLleu_17293 [Holothuria leucospilota]|uniref:Uncharacterized protein n=1 Tax=Holothuria leucospilota TaxID=206669 RepID=A0A9Q1HB66_HOLLE|nr:hypothetical protein HOLleu_17293 [Holothuria leucospilota]